jgi:hypothetical protein
MEYCQQTLLKLDDAFRVLANLVNKCLALSLFFIRIYAAKFIRDVGVARTSASGC